MTSSRLSALSICSLIYRLYKTYTAPLLRKKTVRESSRAARLWAVPTLVSSLTIKTFPCAESLSVQLQRNAAKPIYRNCKPLLSK